MGSSNDIAIVGIGIRCPGAQTPDQFWKNVRDGVESVQWLTEKELLEAGVSANELANPNYVRAGAFLDGYADFDAEFFGLSPMEAAVMDPQHRQFLEVCWEALEHAGHPPSKFAGSIGVFAGCGMGTYMIRNLMSNPHLIESLGYFAIRHTGNDKDFLCNRVSFSLDLRGPSVSVQTACSTSLVAVHLASQSLLLGECDLALAGGVTVELPQRHGYLYREREILSRDGHCRAFDHRSEGTIFGSGAAVVALRRLDDALADRDEIYAVLKGSAVNNDGASKAGYFAPSVDGQAHAVAEALAVAGVPADTIELLEAHGTGTPIGDPIEIAALTQAYRVSTAARGYCGVGSVKTNIGHLDTAAGVVGLIKAALALKHRQMPPSLNWEAPNPAIDFAGSPFYVNDKLRDWPERGHPRRAAVNSLGVGGTNAHAILEEAPAEAVAQPARGIHDDSRAYLLPISARNAAALDDNASRLADHLENHPQLSLVDVATTLRIGRHDFEHRRVLACRSIAQAVTLLRSKDRYQVFSDVASSPAPAIAFLLPGGGAQHAGMAAGLYRTLPVYRDALDHCLALLRDDHQLDIAPLLFADRNTEQGRIDFERPSHQLPALFAVEYALARLWMSWQIRPAALLGHSMGENVAACLAGVISLEDALGLVVLRGRLFEAVPEGGMLSVSASAQSIAPLLSDELAIAVKNGPELCVVSGPVKALGPFAERLTTRGIESTRIPIRTAAHSPMLDAVLPEFRAYLQTIKLHPPQLPIVSNRTGTWMTAEQATDPDYWVGHLRGTVEFSDSLATLLHDYPQCVLLEVGPGATLSSLARLQPAWSRDHHPIPSLPHRDAGIADDDYFVAALGRLWAAGVNVDLSRFHEPGRRIPLPTYAFQHRRYWIEPGKPAASAADESVAIERTANFEDWFYEPCWEPSPLSATADHGRHSWLVFADELGVGAGLADHLRAGGQQVVLVRQGDRNSRRSADEYVVDSDRGAEGYELLVAGLSADGRLPDRIVSLWMLTGSEAFRTHLNRFAHNLERSFYNLFYLIRALAQQAALSDVHIIAVSNGARQVGREPVPDPEKSTLDGPCLVVPHEYPGVTCKSIDLDYREPKRGERRPPTNHTLRSGELSRIVQLLLHELAEPASNGTFAYRERVRYQLQYRRCRSVEASQPKAQATGVRPGGTYLITGGLGGIGLVVAELLARKAKVNLLLTSRSGLPPQHEWESYVARHDDQPSRIIRRVQRLTSLGANVLVAAVDVTDQEELRQFLEQAQQRFGPIHGVIHAAGVVNDRSIAMKTVEEVENVFASKIYGTLVLDMLFERHPLDFFVVFSSSSTVTGPAGQVDYVAANAFLNSYVRSRLGRRHQRLLAINWGVWNEVGMAAEATQHSPKQCEPADHPLFRERQKTPGGDIISLAPIAPATHWWLDEHRLLDGRPVLPGTAYIELATMAADEVAPAACRSIERLEFLVPLTVGDGESRRARVRLQRQDDGYGFEVQSWQASADGQHGWLTHARAHIAALPAIDLPRVDLDAIRARCTPAPNHPERHRPVMAQEHHVRFGPRWQVLRELRFGDGEAIARLELPEAYLADLDRHALHAALLDIATGCAMPLIDGYDLTQSVLWAPAAYARIDVYGALPSTVVSWIRRCSTHGADRSRASFDILIVDPMGRVIVEIHELTLQRLENRDPLAVLERLPANLLESDSPAATAGGVRDLDPSARALALSVAQGIRPDEGMLAFERVIDGRTPQEVVISSLDLAALRSLAAHVADAPSRPGFEFERPSLNNDYVEPSTDDEKQMVELWKELLGIATIGVNDSFFDLGGHSLIAVRLFTMIKNTWGVNLPVGTLLEAPTVSELLGRINEVRQQNVPAADERSHGRDGAAPTVGPWTSVVALRRSGSRPPIFCVAGKGGNPMNLRHLAARLGEDQPFYGIQHRGVDGELPFHESIEEMAAACVRDVRRVQPEGPYVLGGFSAGGLVAFEMAKLLRRSGERIALLFLLDTWDPAFVHRKPASRWSKHLTLLKHRGPVYLFEKSHELWQQIVRRALSRMRRATAVAEVATDVPELTPQQAAANAWKRMEERYVAQPDTLSGMLYRPYRSPQQADWATLRAGNQYNGWDQFLLGGVEVVELPGGHSTMCEEPHVRILAKRLSAAIDSALIAPPNRPPTFSYGEGQWTSAPQIVDG